jgi:hypothetical protein
MCLVSGVGVYEAQLLAKHPRVPSFVMIIGGAGIMIGGGRLVGEDGGDGTQPTMTGCVPAMPMHRIDVR